MWSLDIDRKSTHLFVLNVAPACVIFYFEFKFGLKDPKKLDTGFLGTCYA